VSPRLQFVDHPAAFSYKLPEGVGHEQGAMCEPLSVGVHAVRRAAIPPGADVAVIGSGPIGGSLSSDLCFIGCRCVHRSYDPLQ
jgi:threonine dehydrogenase-like Zn-dependent dehydrogenase